MNVFGQALAAAALGACLAAGCTPVQASLYDCDQVTLDGDAVNFLSRTAIETLQLRLTANGFNPGPVDGAWGRKTSQAITEYFSAKGLGGEDFNLEAAFRDLLGDGNTLDLAAWTRRHPGTGTDHAASDPLSDEISAFYQGKDIVIHKNADNDPDGWASHAAACKGAT